MNQPWVVDAHQHFWDPARAHYPWMSDELAAIRRAIGPDELRPLLRPAGVDHTVLVQTRASLDETLELLEIADHTDFVAGVVGWVDLSAADVADTLGKIMARPHGRWLAGIRHQIHDEPDPLWAARPDVTRGIRAVGAAGLAYDLLTRETQLPACTLAVDACPDVRFVVNHIAKPRIAERAMEPWLSRLRELALRPNVTCKLSGMVTEADWRSWQADDFRPYVEPVLEMFGPDRLMFGSDWPVCLLAADYGGVKSALSTVLGEISSGTRAAIFGANATRIYRLDGATR